MLSNSSNTLPEQFQGAARKGIPYKTSSKEDNVCYILICSARSSKSTANISIKEYEIPSLRSSLRIAAVPILYVSHRISDNDSFGNSEKFRIKVQFASH